MLFVRVQHKKVLVFLQLELFLLLCYLFDLRGRNNQLRTFVIDEEAQVFFVHQGRSRKYQSLLAVTINSSTLSLNFLPLHWILAELGKFFHQSRYFIPHRLLL